MVLGQQLADRVRNGRLFQSERFESGDEWPLGKRQQTAVRLPLGDQLHPRG